MPTLAFGLNAPKSKFGGASTKPMPQKRKNLFDDDPDDGDDHNGGASDEDGFPRPKKSPKLSHPQAVKNGHPSRPQKYTNLASLHSAKLHEAEAATVDSSIYDYDSVYDTFQAAAAAKKNKASSANGGASGPKYMTSLLASAEVRKRDQLRAKEKLLQRERENEGDEFADKEKFVTGAYLNQQEEVKKLEEEERRREEEEEERRKKGEGMIGWHKEVLRKEEERMQQIQKAAEEKSKLGTIDGKPTEPAEMDQEEEEDAEQADAKIAAKLNQRGAHIIVNDDGEVVDKRQLLSAGLNVAAKPKPSSFSRSSNNAPSSSSTTHDHSSNRSSSANQARLSQRERQTRMMEAQIQQMEQQAREAEEAEQRAREEKAKSSKTEEQKMSARERFLARKKEREEEEKRKK